MNIYGAGSIDDIKKCTELGVAGILTNPQGFDQFYKGKMTLKEITEAILDVSDSNVFIQIHGKSTKQIIERAEALYSLSDRVGFKIISDKKGFEAIKVLQDKGIDCIATCLFSVSQAAIAKMVGAYGVCPFFSRARVFGADPIKLIQSIKNCYKSDKSSPEIIVASLKGVGDINDAISAGADSIALRYPALLEMMNHALTDKAEALFAKNWLNVKGEDVSYLKDKMKQEGVAE